MTWCKCDVREGDNPRCVYHGVLRLVREGEPGPGYRYRWYPPLARRDGTRGKSGYIWEKIPETKVRCPCGICKRA